VEPSERKLRADLETVRFQQGVSRDAWNVVALECGVSWPFVVFWIGAAPREGAPDRFYVRLDLTAYPKDPPTGTFWDVAVKAVLEAPRRPFGSGQTERVFRVDWQSGQAFYHPYDRVAANSHADWPQRYPHWVWSDRHTVTDLLEVLWDLLNSAQYEGLRGAR
jgi:hypothetical protein